MKKRELINLGFGEPGLIRAAQVACAEASRQGYGRHRIRSEMRLLAARPDRFLSSPVFGPLARLVSERPASTAASLRDDLDYARWGDDIDAQAHRQMANACRLPVSVAGALMPDAHVGYGLPIGGVLATDNAVIPYAVGVDIACRVRLTVFDLPPEKLQRSRQWFEEIIEKNTLFGVGKAWKHPPEHPVLDEDWSITPITRQVKDLADHQIGTSGSGNHFVDFGVIEFGANDVGVEPGRYVAVLTHSGSRGPGARVAGYYSRIARDLHTELPRELSYLAWLDLDSEPGREYWEAMELMGRFAAANHAVIHRRLRTAVGGEVVFEVENHHNFAWKEVHGGRSVIVHRKGATPAGRGVLGVIPGSMTAPAYLVRGLGEPSSLDSAAHGAGRRMSRTEARKSTRWSSLRELTEGQGVHLISAGLDECPQAYKDIKAVMGAQADLVEPLARFTPKLVKMAPEGEKPED